MKKIEDLETNPKYTEQQVLNTKNIHQTTILDIRVKDYQITQKVVLTITVWSNMSVF